MTNDDQVERATTFNGDDAPPGKRLDNSESLDNYYSRLSLANSLDFNGKWKDRRRETQKNASAIVDAVAGQLELTDYQVNEAHRYFTVIPNRFNESHSTEVVALCVCGLAGRQDGRDYHPNAIRPSTDVDTTFAEIANGTGVSYNEFHSVWEAIRQELGL